LRKLEKQHLGIRLSQNHTNIADVRGKMGLIQEKRTPIAGGKKSIGKGRKANIRERMEQKAKNFILMRGGILLFS